MPNDESLERRVTAIEAAVAEIQRRLAEAASSAPPNWLERIAGSMQDEPAFEDVLRYGREFRAADQPGGPEA